MNTTFVSTSALSDALRRSIRSAQSELHTAGARPPRGRGRQSRQPDRPDRPASPRVRLDAGDPRCLEATQVGLASVTATAEEFLRVALDTRDGGAGKEIAVAQANGALEALAADLTATLGGAQLFGGTRTGALRFLFRRSAVAREGRGRRRFSRLLRVRHG